MTGLSIGLDNGAHYRFSVCGVKLKSNGKVTVYTHDVCATIASVDLSVVVASRVHSWV